MKAAVCYEYGKPLVIEEVDLDPPKRGEVKVKLAATAICHSDIHMLGGDLPGPLPLVGGHESAGHVVELGEGVTAVKPGDTVVVSLLANCGKCKYCLRGQPHLCNAQWPLDTEARMHNKKGQGLIQLLRTGSFAEYTIVDQSQLIKIPEDMPLDRAALLACGVITGFGAVVNRAKVEVMSSCVIIGVGGVGLNAVQGAAISGAYPIIAVDISDSKLQAARSFGATHTVNSAKVDPVQTVKDITDGGAEYVFVTVGNCEAVSHAYDMCGPRGMTVVVGLPKATDTIDFSPLTIIKDEKILTGGYMGSCNWHLDIPRLVDLYKAGILKLDELITHRLPLEKINEGIAEVVRGEVLRNVIMFE